MKNNKDKSKTLIYRSKGKSVLIEPIFNSHKICFDFDQRDIEINTKPKKYPNKNRNKNFKNLNFNSRKFRTKTTSAKKESFKNAQLTECRCCYRYHPRRFQIHFCQHFGSLQAICRCRDTRSHRRRN